MADYVLSGLSTREFEHLVQALALDAVSPQVQPFGDGPDGAREATCDGLQGHVRQGGVRRVIRCD